MSKPKLKNLSQGDLQALTGVMSVLLEKQTARLLTKKDIQDLVSKHDLLASNQTLMATKQDLLASKEDLETLKIDVKDYIHQGVETVMAGMDSLEEKLAEKDKVDKLSHWAIKVGHKVGIKPNL